MFKKRLKSHHAHELRPGKLSLPLTKGGLEKRLSKPPSSKEGIIYFHVPYCDKICSFCSMNRTKLDGELEEYTEYLLKEIEYYSKFEYIQGKEFESIYFGGGTPTILKTHQIERVLKSINKNFNLSSTCEFNFESTLHNLSFEKLNLMQSMGVNRYSIGIQSFSDRGRKFLNRTGSGQKAQDKLLKIRENFKGNMCIDIIYNLPEQTKEEIYEDACITKKVGADSVSFYSLMFHEGSAMDGSEVKDYYELETDKMLHDTFVNGMLEDDYEILELTKISKIGRDQYKYIRLQHKGVDMLPIGVGAGGALAGVAGFSPKRGLKFFKRESEKIQKLKVFTALFQHPIILFSDMKKQVNQKTFDKVYALLKELEKLNYVKLKDDCVVYTIDGIFWGNNISNEVLKIALKEY